MRLFRKRGGSREALLHPRRHHPGNRKHLLADVAAPNAEDHRQAPPAERLLYDLMRSLIDKVYKRKNLEMAWEKAKANRGSGGGDGQSLEAFEAQLDQQLYRLQRELKEDTYQPQPVRQYPIQKRDKPGEYRMLGIPTIYDRVCQQALLNL